MRETIRHVGCDPPRSAVDDGHPAIIKTLDIIWLNGRVIPADRDPAGLDP